MSNPVCTTLQEFITRFNDVCKSNESNGITFKFELNNDVLAYLLDKEKKGEIDTYGWIYNTLAAVYRKNTDKHLYYLAKGIECNNILSLYNMGVYYEKSTSIEFSLDFYERSANLGDLPSFIKLGSLYENIDIDKSYYWFKQACLLGSEESKNILRSSLVFSRLMVEEMMKKNKLEKLDIGSLIYDNIKRYY